MKKKISGSLVLFSIFFVGCNSKSIENQLKSKNKDDIISGSIRAGRSKQRKYISLLLDNAEDWRKSSNFEFKGKTVYQAKMEALQQILNIDPPHPITDIPDTSIIRFYSIRSQ